MTTFYLQYGIAHRPGHTNHNSCGWHEQRVFLDEYIHEGNELLRTIEADSWLDARMDISGY